MVGYRVRPSPSPSLRMRAKVCLVGEAAVGKTSLIRRFTVNAYDDKYVMTIGAKVSKKDLVVPLPQGDVRVTLTIWDIMGMKGFRQLLQEAYFTGAQGLVAVADVTRSTTLTELDGWIDGAFGIAGEVPVIVAGNKEDLRADAELDTKDVETFARRLGVAWAMTSAKTGANVEDAFRRLATRIAKAWAAGAEDPTR